MRYGRCLYYLPSMGEKDDVCAGEELLRDSSTHSLRLLVYSFKRKKICSLPLNYSLL